MVAEVIDILGLDHVQVAIPEGQEEAARAFYGGILGLREVPKPSALALRGGCWFVGPGVALHLGVEDDFRPAWRAHPAFLVPDLATTAERLAAAGIATVPDESGLPVRRLYVRDPFGNRIELVDRRDAGFTTPR